MIDPSRVTRLIRRSGPQVLRDFLLGPAREVLDRVEGLALPGAFAADRADGATPVAVVASAGTTPEVVEYPDTGKIAAMAKTPSQRGPGLWTMHFLENEVGYWDANE